MELHDNLTFDDAKIEQAIFDPGDDGLGCVLVLSAKLTADIADSLGRRDFLYDKSGIARAFDGEIKLGESMREVELRIPPTRNSMKVRPTIIRKFSVQHSKAKGDSDIALRIKMRAHFKDWLDEVFAFAKETNKDLFRMRIEPMSGALFEAGVAEEKEEQQAETVGV